MTPPDETAAPPPSSSAEQPGSGNPAPSPQDGGEHDDEGARERVSRGEETLGEIVQMLIENPLVNQALQVAFGARDAATQVTSRTMKNLNFANSADVERLGRRLRSLSDRLEAVEDRLDELIRDNRQPPPAT